MSINICKIRSNNHLILLLSTNICRFATLINKYLSQIAGFANYFRSIWPSIKLFCPYFCFQLAQISILARPVSIRGAASGSWWGWSTPSLRSVVAPSLGLLFIFTGGGIRVCGAGSLILFASLRAWAAPHTRRVCFHSSDISLADARDSARTHACAGARPGEWLENGQMACPKQTLWAKWSESCQNGVKIIGLVERILQIKLLIAAFASRILQFQA